jgi:hypothetical protein
MSHGTLVNSKDLDLEIPEKLSDWQLLKKDSTLWS